MIGNDINQGTGNDNNIIQGDSQEVGNFLGGELVLGTW